MGTNGIIRVTTTDMARRALDAGRDMRRHCAGGVHAARVKLAAWGHLCLGDGGQGTTEYAILVGVLVVIAIVAVTAFRGKLTELWSAITDGINGL